MQIKKIIKSLLVCAMVMLNGVLLAQTTSTKNTYSLYSMYGIGEIATQGTLSMRSMGGAGVGSRTATSINLINPASYSVAIQQGILLDIGLEGAFVTNAQDNAGSVSKSGYIAANIHNISLQLPITRGFGLAFSVAPYSSVGYNINTYDASQSEIGIQSYNFQGTGDITEVRIGAGVKIAKGLSLGVTMQYYWGLLERYYSIVIFQTTGSNTPSPVQGVSATYVSKLKAQFGLQWDAYAKDYTMLTIGAVYDMGGNITPEEEVWVATGSASDVAGLVSVDEARYPALYMPHQITLGATYRDRKWHAATDLTFQKWGDSGSVLTTQGVEVAYRDVYQAKFGVEYTPNRLDSRRYMRRAAYRAGARVGNYYQTFGDHTLMEWAITAGVGLPIKMFGMSNIDVGIEYGSLGSLKSVYSGSNSMNLVRQNSFKLSVGVTLFGDDYWFQRIKYD